MGNSPPLGHSSVISSAFIQRPHVAFKGRDVTGKLRMNGEQFTPFQTVTAETQPCRFRCPWCGCYPTMSSARCYPPVSEGRTDSTCIEEDFESPGALNRTMLIPPHRSLGTIADIPARLPAKISSFLGGTKEQANATADRAYFLLPHQSSQGEGVRYPGVSKR